MQNHNTKKRSLWGPYLLGLGFCMVIVSAIAANIKTIDFAQVVVMVIFTVTLLVSGAFVWYSDRMET